MPVSLLERIDASLLMALPLGLVLFLAFSAGGFYPGASADVAMVLAVVMAIRLASGRTRFRLGGRLALVTGALAGYALLTLLSQVWSHAPGRAVIEFDRVLAYLLVFVLFASVPHSADRLRWVLRALALGVVVICACSLITRLLPSIWPTSLPIGSDRLSFPLTYWNGLGLLGAFGVVLCLHLTADPVEAVATRVAAAASIPVLATTIFFTFSRGAMAAAALGVAVYFLLAPKRSIASVAISVIPVTAVAIKFAYDARLLADGAPTQSGAVVQGEHVALAVLGCAVLAGLTRAVVGGRFDQRLGRRLRRVRAGIPGHRWRRGWVVGAVLFAAVATGVGAVEYPRFLSPSTHVSTADLRGRLTNPQNNGRVAIWRVAVDQFERTPVLGRGAGTFETTWDRYRATQNSVLDAHSLYAETLDELGLVGFMLLAAVIAGVLVSAAARLREPAAPPYAAAFAVLLVWTLHAGIDWDWEIPAVTVPFFALGGCLLADQTDAPESRRRPGGAMRAGARLAGAAGFFALAVVPASVALSQLRLDRASAAYAAGNCRMATRSALASISALDDRPDPYELVSYCDVRQQKPRSALNAIRLAVALDPGDARFRYDLAVVQAAAGGDPIPAAREAVVLDSRDPLTRRLLRALTADNRLQRRADGRAVAEAGPTLPCGSGPLGFAKAGLAVRPGNGPTARCLRTCWLTRVYACRPAGGGPVLAVQSGPRTRRRLS